MALTIVVNGGGTFSASMEEGPVSFTASLAAVGPAGPAGPGVAEGGLTGQVLAKASGTDYDTEWVARNPFNQSLNTTDTVNFGEVRIPSPDNHAKLDLYMWRPFSNAHGDLGIEYRGDKVIFADATEQSTALPSGLDDGYIVEWNADTNTYNSVPNDARTLFITARNITGTTIPKGSVVLISGASGNRPTIALAQADTGAGADGVIGITAAAINNNANGRVITEGLASNLNTSAFAAGDKLYLSSTTPGGLVNVRPVQPAHSVAIGTVTWSNPAVGTIEVRVQVGEHLEFLHDVLLTSRANGDFLVYESATDLWKNRTLASLDLLTATSAAATYLTQSSAAATYQTLAGMSAYLTTSAAASTYAPIASPTFTGTVTIPAGASISGFAPLASPVFTGVPEAPTAAATTDTTQVATTAFTQDVVDAQRVDVQIFGSSTTSGSFNWDKPAGAKFVQVRMCGGGGGGGSGGVGATTQTRLGAGGASGGSWSFVQMPASELPSQVAIVVGAGGAGGAGKASGSASAGTNGESTSFGSYQALRGSAPTGGSGAAGLLGSVFNLLATVATPSGGAGATTTGASATNVVTGLFFPTGGGGGGGAAPNVTTAAAGGSGGSRSGGTSPSSYTDTLAGGAGGTDTGTAATNGTDGDVAFAGGTGGGGGFYITGQNGGSGGHGGWPGGGGGGGGACDSGFTSGAGGNGANGVVIVTTYF